jgi:hypothetical protein
VTPDQRHHGRERAVLTCRHNLYERVRRAKPERWSASTRNRSSCSTPNGHRIRLLHDCAATTTLTLTAGINRYPCVRTDLMLLVGREGIEPSTNGLRARSYWRLSSAEARPQPPMHAEMYTFLSQSLFMPILSPATHQANPTETRPIVRGEAPASR